MFHRNPYDRDHVGDDEHDVLRHLRPRHRAHATEEAAHQNAAEAEEDPQLERDAGEAGRDEADAVDLRHHVGERAQDRAADPDEPRNVSAVAGAEEVGDRELAELAQVGREEERHQAVAAGPAHHEGEAVVPGQVQRSGHPDERRRAHPVGTGRHAVEERGDAPARHVVLGDVGRPAHDADAGVEADGGEQEDVADPLPRQPELLEDREDDDEEDEPARVPAVHLLQHRVELQLRHRGHDQSSPSATPYSWSSLFM